MPGWLWSVLVLSCAIGVFAFARYKASLPSDPLNVRIIDYFILEMVAFVAGLFALIFLIYLLTGSHIQTRLGPAGAAIEAHDGVVRS